MHSKQPTCCVELELLWFERVSGEHGLEGHEKSVVQDHRNHYCAQPNRTGEPQHLTIVLVPICHVFATALRCEGMEGEANHRLFF